MIISNFQRVGDTMQSCNKEQIGAKGIAVHDDDGGVQCRCWCISPVRLLSCRKPHLTAVPGGVGLASVVPRVPILVVTSTLGMPGLAGGRVPPREFSYDTYIRCSRGSTSGDINQAALSGFFTRRQIRIVHLYLYNPLAISPYISPTL